MERNNLKSNGSTLIWLGLPRRRSNQNLCFHAIQAHYKTGKNQKSLSKYFREGFVPLTGLEWNRFMQDLNQIVHIQQNSTDF